MVETASRQIRKIASGIVGLDDVLNGGLPEGRTTLVGGGPGTGKSILALEFLYRGAAAGEPGIYITFEERAQAVRENGLTLGWNLEALEKAGKLAIIEARIDAEALVSGDFDTKALMAIVEGKAAELGARRVVFDALDVLMRVFDEPAHERNQLYLLHDWLRDRGFTALLTIKASGDNTVANRYEFLEFMADCVIWLSQRPSEQVYTREIQVIKYRGSAFGRNRYPFVIVEGGIEVIPISMMELQHEALGAHVSTGNEQLDAVLGGGFRRASSILIAGAAGTGKTTMASTFAGAAAKRGEKVLYVGYEESQEAILASMLSVGIDLRPAIQKGLLRIMTAMPEAMGTEEHLVRVLHAVEAFHPEHIIVDAISSARRMGSERAAFDYAVRLGSEAKSRGITVIMTTQTGGLDTVHEISGMGISSIIDAVIILRYIAIGGELNRALQVMKSRGSPHSNQTREFMLTDRGLKILDVYTGEGGVLTGTARHEQEAREALEARRREVALREKEFAIAEKKAELEAQTARLKHELELAESEFEALSLDQSFRESEREERSEIRHSSNAAAGKRKISPPVRKRRRNES